MKRYEEADQIDKKINESNKILIVQADNPDADSLGSALALEQILFKMGKDTTLYCGVNMPSYLHYFQGWDRVSNDIPSDIDLSILVDASSESLMETLARNSQKNIFQKKPLIVLDHHVTKSTIQNADVICNKEVVSTGELIYELSLMLNWTLNDDARENLVSSIMSDSMGLNSEATSARSIEIVSKLVGESVSMAKLDARRREFMKKSSDMLSYKADLIKRIEYHDEGRIATITIPWSEIERYSNEYNPSMLVLDEMRLVEGVQVVIAFKTYNDGRITGKIRCNYGYSIANRLAEQFNGGGHKYASGFKINKSSGFNEVKKQVIDSAIALLAGDMNNENL